MAGHVSSKHYLDDSASEEPVLLWCQVLHEIVSRPPQNLKCCRQVHVLVHTDIIVHQGSFIPGVDQEVIGHTCTSAAIMTAQRPLSLHSIMQVCYVDSAACVLWYAL